MTNYWTVSEFPDCTRYQAFDGPVTGSLTPADEIDGMTISQAVRTLESMYPVVQAWRESRVIICRREATE